MNRIVTIDDIEAMYDEFHNTDDTESCTLLHIRAWQLRDWGRSIIHGGDILEFDEIFGEIDLHRLDSQLIAALMRALHYVHIHLTNWPEKYDEACDLLLYRGNNRLATELLHFATYS